MSREGASALPGLRAAGHADPRPVLWAFLACLLVALACDRPVAAPPPTPERVPGSLRMGANGNDVMVDDTLRFWARVFDTRGGEMYPADMVHWEVSDSTAITLDSLGMATARGRARLVGSFVVRARYRDISAELPIKVSDYPQLNAGIDSISLSALGESRSLSAMRSGLPIQASFELAGESRHLPELAVVRADSVPAGRVVATGPGSALVLVRAARSRPDTVVVRVRPATPLLVSWQASSESVTERDSIRLRGYGLERLAADSLLLDGAPARRLRSDSANLFLAVPKVHTSDCSSPAPLQLVVRGVAGQPVSVAFPRAPLQAPALGIGEAVALSSADVACLVLAPAAGRPARYLLAYAHTDPLEDASKSGLPFVPYLPNDSVTITVTDGSAAAASMKLRMTAPGPVDPQRLRSDVVAEGAGGPLRPSAGGGDALTGRATPWRVGDEATIQSLASWQPRTITARVVKLYGPAQSIVVMVVAGGEADFAQVQPVLDSALTWVVAQMVPLYARVLSATPPRTSPQVDQLVLVVSPPDPTSWAGGLSGAWIELALPGGSTAVNLVELLAHEMAHEWHMARRAGSTSAAPTAGSWQQWNVEGLADLFATEALRRWFGYGFEDNLPPRLFPERGNEYSLKTYQIDGRYLAVGYARVAALLRHITWTLMREKGLAYDDALALVAQGASAGWYGCGGWDCSAVGLAERMQQQLGRPWKPEDALLDWTLTTAVDDVVGGFPFTDPSFTGFSYLSNPWYVGFPPTFTISAGGGGARATVLSAGCGFIDIHTGTTSARFQVGASAGMAWKLMRIE